MMCRTLRLPAMTSSGCQALLELTEFVMERGIVEEWLDLMTREDGYVMALARATSDARKEAKENVEETES